MAKGKKIVKWGAIVLAALIYLSICAVPFFQLNPTVAEAEATANAKYKIHPIWTMEVKDELTGNPVDTVILTLGEVIVLGVLVAMLIAVVVLMLKKKEKTASMVRAYESEVKRITWLSWKDTKKSTVVVLIGLVVCTAVICLLDLGLSEGFLQFVNLFQAK